MTLSLGFTAIFRFFRTNFNGQYFGFVFSQFPFQGISISSQQFSRYRDAVCGILRTTKLATIRRTRNFEFLLLVLGFTAIFRFFRKNFNSRYFCFAFSHQFLYHAKCYSSYSFQDIEMRFAAFYAQLI